MVRRFGAAEEGLKSHIKRSLQLFLIFMVDVFRIAAIAMVVLLMHTGVAKLIGFLAIGGEAEIGVYLSKVSAFFLVAASLIITLEALRVLVLYTFFRR